MILISYMNLRIYIKIYRSPISFILCGPYDKGPWGAKIYLKREDLNHTGSHKLNNVIGQMLLAKRMGKTRVIAETGAGQHGVATATIAALMGMECEVYMGQRTVNVKHLTYIV